MELLAMGLFIVCILYMTLVVLHMAWKVSRADRVLSDWARSNGYEILRKERDFLGTGPFLLRSWGLPVFYVTVQNGQGHTRRAWVRCGSWWTGLLSDKVTVKWDEGP